MEIKGKQIKESESLDFQVVDKRQFLDLDKIEKDELAEEKPRYPTFVEELMARLAETERRFEEKKKLIDEEITRTKVRLETDFQRSLELEKRRTVLPFLDVLDNLERAIGATLKNGTASSTTLLEGLQMTARLFLSKLQALGIEAIAVLDQPFDPNLEHAIGTVEVTDQSRDGLVVEEVQRGYIMNGQLLRPAQVRIGRLSIA